LHQKRGKTEFSRILDLRELPLSGLTINLEATVDECDLLCQTYRLVRIESLSAKIRVKHERIKNYSEGIRVHGKVNAQVTETCVISLEKFSHYIEDEFTIDFVEASELHDDDDVVVEVLSDDLPEPLLTHEIDVGDLVSQHLALVLDPYPRRPGVAWEGHTDSEKDFSPEEGSDKPFAILRNFNRTT